MIFFSEPHKPFNNRTIHPFPLVRAVSNMQDFAYHEELMGYRYDCIDGGGFGCPKPRFLLRKDNIGAEKLFICIYETLIKKDIVLIILFPSSILAEC